MTQPTSMPHILVVEDDKELNQLVSGRLESDGYKVTSVETGPTALEAVANDLPDLILLDVMLPEMDGMEVCRRVRADHPLLYIIMLTARSGEIDRVVGLEVGADDYVTKPFSLQELVARIRSALRRIRLTRENTTENNKSSDEKPISLGEIYIDPIRREVKLKDQLLHLTVREYDLLYHLAKSPDRPFTRSQLLEEVWDITYEGYDRTVDSHVQRLRTKVEENPADPRYIKTVWGIGYKFQSEAGE